MNAQQQAKFVELVAIFDTTSEEKQMKVLAVAEAIVNKDADEERMMLDFLNGNKDALQPIYDRYIPKLEQELKTRACCM